jgi:multidrug efflux system membrane fusion protein
VIVAGLAAGELVVTTGFARLAEGTKISVSRVYEGGPVGQGNGGANAKGKRAQASEGAATPLP